MYKSLTAVTAFIVLIAATIAMGEEVHRGPQAAIKATSAMPGWSWTGAYIGGHLGGALGTSAVADPYGSPIFGDTIRQPGLLAGGQIGFNYQFGATVFGIEADASWANFDGTSTCFAVSALFFSSNCHFHSNWFATATGRLGWAFGPSGRMLVYGKAGAAWASDQVDFIVNNNPAAGNFAASSTFIVPGWTIGAGAEYALNSKWSVKFEYDFLRFDSHDVPTPSVGVPFTLCTPPPAICFATPTGQTNGQPASISSDVHQFKLGLNYMLSNNPNPSDWGGLIQRDGPALGFDGWQLEMGGRYWYSSGRFQKDFGAGPVGGAFAPDVLISRLTYDGMRTNSGELFGRVDSPWNIFVKGYAGLGGSVVGHLNDEDWLAGPGGGLFPYSNTLSQVHSSIDYATIDIGYDIFRRSSYKFGIFVGYNYFHSVMNAYGCVQTANTVANCVPSIPSSFLGIAEDDKWQSLRFGVSGNVMLAPRLKLEGDVAFLPYVSYDAVDHHTRGPRIFPASGHGTGVQLESILSYLVTDQFSLGVGGRYWAMRTTNGQRYEIAGGGVTPPTSFRAAVEQAGVFVQAAYKFGTRWE